MSKLFEGLRESLGMTPVDTEDEKSETQDKKPEDQKTATQENPATQDNKTENQNNKTETQDKKPETQDNKPEDGGGQKHFTNIEDLTKFLEENGFKVERRDLQDNQQSDNQPAQSQPAPQQPQPQPQPTPQQPQSQTQPVPQPVPQAPFIPAQDTTPKVYQNPHLGVRLVQDGDFYNSLANGAYDFDRRFGHGETKLDPAIISWIGSLYPDVQELADDFIKNRLRDTLAKNPGLIPEVKRIAREVTELSVPYALTFVSKMDDTEYQDRKDAEAALAPYEKIGATMKAAYNKRYRRRHFDGTLGEIVSPSEVYNFAKNYDGDLDRLCRELALNRDKVIGTSDPSTGSAGD